MLEDQPEEYSLSMTNKVAATRFATGMGKSEEPKSFRNPQSEEIKQKGPNPHTANVLNNLNSEVELDTKWYDRVLNWAANPFAYETGFYYKGKKTYHVRACGLVTITGFVFALSCFIILIVPVLTGAIVESDVKIIPFNTPADIPIDDIVPGWFRQQFGWKVPRVEPTIDLKEFISQFQRIDVYGINNTNVHSSNDIFQCYANGETVIISDNIVQNSFANVKTKLNYNWTMQMSLKLADEKITNITVPQDSMIKCTFKYKGAAEQDALKISKSQIHMNILQAQGQRYEKDSSEIKTYPLEYDQQLNQTLLMINQLKQEQRLIVHVNELTSNTVESNGKVQTNQKYYFRSTADAHNPPTISIDTSEAYDADFAADIYFFFEFQYAYNNIKGAGILDAMVKFSTLMIYFFVVWMLCKQIVKYLFYKELYQEILKADQQIQLTKGDLPKSMQSPLKRFAEQLSFSKMYFNQFQISKLEQLMKEARQSSLQQFSGRIIDISNQDKNFQSQVLSNERQIAEQAKLLNLLKRENQIQAAEIESLKKVLAGMN